MGRSQVLLTQNVDRLHQAARSRVVIDLHGRLALGCCMARSDVPSPHRLSGRSGPAQ
ncbi:Sir2 family NAD-dependent protein deacetylase [Bradyrhizobium sp. DASA03007]|uniref:Sir2 family NAD-dependent protein deacetylase n=1 Tax=unclassified Bradyrhizobium TaxID=2631580 RepID=UPI003F701CFD